MDQTAQDTLFGLQVGYTTGRNFRDISKWTTFLSIVLFIGIGILLLAIIFGGSAILRLYSTGYGAIAGSFVGIFMAIGIAFLALYFFAALMLIRFASLMKQAIDNQDQHAFNQSLRAFKNYFLISGVLSILTFFYSILTLIITLVPNAVTSMF